MKKIVLFLSIVAAAIACEQVEPVTPPEFDFANPDVLIPYQGSEDEGLKLEFTTNVDWTAELDQTYDWVTITPKSGVAGDAVITVVATPNKETAERTAVITVKAGVSVLTFDVVQEGFPTLKINPTEVVFASAGGSQDVTIDANVEYVVTMPENDWLTYKYNSETAVYTLTAAANEAYTGRSLTITLSNDVDGIEETLVVSQDGRIKMEWQSTLTSLGATMGNVKVAAYGDKVLVAANGKVYVANASDGTLVNEVTLPAGFAVHSIAVDDANNIVFAGPDAAFHGTYDNTDDDEYVSVYYISGLDKVAEPTSLISFNVENCWCTKMGNVRVKGDVTKNAVVTAYAGCPWSADGSTSGYWFAWEIKNGVVGEKVSNTVALGSGNDTNTGVVYPVGTSLSDGLFYVGYGSGILYNSDPAANNWASAGALYGNGWMETFCSFSTAVYDGKTYAAIMSGCIFSYDNPELLIYDVTDPANAVLLAEILDVESSTEHTGNSGDYTLYPYSDCSIVAAEDGLVIYVVDASYDTFTKVSFK